MNYLFLPYKRFVDFSGRSRPLEYWLYVLFYSVQVAAAVFIDLQFGLGGDFTSYSDFGNGGASVGFNINFGPVAIAVTLLNLLPGVAVSIRRAHDSNRRGWWLLVPIYNFFLVCFPGTPGPNRFGPDPKAPPASQIFS